MPGGYASVSQGVSGPPDFTDPLRSALAVLWLNKLRASVFSYSSPVLPGTTHEQHPQRLY